VAFARWVFDEYGGFDPGLPIMCDAEAILRWMAHASVLLLPDGLSLRREHAGSVSFATMHSRAMEETMAGLIKRVMAVAQAIGMTSDALPELAASLDRSFWQPYRLTE
jgi:hypothetical protein